ncbi:hypothetical protein COCC4DRAFT_131706 [Bipolaris maydis ATCC 48331]|uniref:Uncharacterized protein n=2 Tax=Cochliobolus heterostrophus TaxID=5016 RepID=M2T6G8_COCH5|nr:uncharacterized protein COCC4DRAFT_131706 [Bipolaris maydis ATCC 48331]EMD93190.1 hypothetical protein COCHEDRAFT_1211930 [Bipolaris maydis C5]EMD94183.1 hypothetical protein COCHEDRAFT_1211612 [Bipolaris maydis C5]ENI07517.1 hypothetical protein COCC4DRAFT_131706 [Bipolaris maydis ATCC 48331]KAH7564004.1 hypothetical protein BM1_01051 [Bipolaris maydis]
MFTKCLPVDRTDVTLVAGGPSALWSALDVQSLHLAIAPTHPFHNLTKYVPLADAILHNSTKVIWFQNYEFSTLRNGPLMQISKHPAGSGRTSHGILVAVPSAI